MKHFIKSLIPRFDRRWANVRNHILPFLAVVTLLMAFYAASRLIMPGWTTWAISAAALLIVGITALARANDIAQDQVSARWQFRRAGLILVGAACIGIVLAPWIGGGSVTQPDWPAWREVMFRVGVALTWLTTPMMPPWHHYISGEYRKQVVEVAEDVSVEIKRIPTSEASPNMYESKK